MTDNMLEYKDFYGSVEYSAEDECFHGKIVGIADLVTFEGDSIVSLREGFREMVDGYIEDCKILGKNPLKKYEGTFNVVIPPELHREAAIAAGKRGISLNDFVKKAISSELYI
ncbi:MAG: type II toxin-antitoxin system HicB family antitoxin [Oscillospiraceae bacterium]|nr:type II toxin-antitoxin system HicB family antitoxin [Oscillospiraceae bacterium]